MKRRTQVSVEALVVMCMLPCTALRAQTGPLELFYEQQASLAEGIVNELQAPSVERRLFSLRTANLMLSSSTTPSSFAFEDAVEAGALPALEALADDANPEVAELARRVRSRIVEELGLQSRGDSLSILDGAATENLTANEYAGWLSFEAEAGTQYRVRAIGCEVIRAVAFPAGEQTAFTGGTVVGRGFTFDAATGGSVEMRVRTARCAGSGGITVSSGPPLLDVPASATLDNPFPVAAGYRYAGGLPPGESQWFSIPAREGQSFVIEVIPVTDGLDPFVAVQDASGIEVAYNDDHGTGRGSLVEVASPPTGTLTIEVGSFYSYTSGEYELAVTALPPPIERATTIAAAEAVPSNLAPGESEWWRFDSPSEGRYRVQTSLPGSLPDTVLTVLRSDGVTLIGQNDDFGYGLASRVEFFATPDSPVLIKVHSISGDGPYSLSVTPDLIEFANGGAAASSGSYESRLPDSGEIWWKFDTPAGRYELEVIPESGVDSIIEIYGSDGQALVGFDDNSGSNFGSKLAFSTPVDDVRLVRVSSVGLTAGRFEIVLTELPSIGELAQEASAGETYRGEVELNGERWWMLEVEDGGDYVIEARPVGVFDSVITAYSDEGVTEVGFDDDGGGNSGSLLDFHATFSGPLFIKVTGYGGAGGAFEFSVRED